MARLRPLVVAIGVVLFLTISASFPGAAASSARIVADVVEFDLASDRTSAFGDAVLSWTDLELHANALTADRTTGEIEASGDLRVTQGARRLTGRSIQYNLQTGVGLLLQARAEEQGVIVMGERLSISPGAVVAEEARFTTCDRPDPHFALVARRISLTAAEAAPGEPPTSGRLSFQRARVTYRNRPLLKLPGYSVKVGDLHEPGAMPIPITGFSGRDGPYAAIRYRAGWPEESVGGELSYRYTTRRGIRGHLMLARAAGPVDLSLGYYRRDDPADRRIEPDDLEASLADVLVNRQPEYGAVMPPRRVGRSFTGQASVLAGRYSERSSDGDVELVAADRTSVNLFLRSDPRRVSERVQLSHALGWRHSRYSPGDDLTVGALRHTAEVEIGPQARLELSHITRRRSGETPFLFDGVGPARELLGELRVTLSPAWRMRFVEYYDLQIGRPRDIILEATRTAHCLEYTVGWRRERGTIYAAVGLAGAAPRE